MNHPEAVQTLIDSMLVERDKATDIVLINRHSYSITVERITDPAQMQRAMTAIQEMNHERSA